MKRTSFLGGNVRLVKLVIRLHFTFVYAIGADLPGAVDANAPKGKGSVGACTQRMHPEEKQEAQLPLRNRASATYFFVAKLISIAHSCH